MNELISIRNLGQYGINTDLEESNLPLNVLTSGYNFRVKNGKIWPVVDKQVLSTPTGFNAGYLLGVKTSTDQFVLVAGNTAVKVFDGATWTDISSVAGYVPLGTDDEVLWSGCLLGNIPIINNFQHYPEYWSPQAITQILQPLNFDPANTWAAKNFAAKVFRSHGQYMFALNLREVATYLPDSYRWSHPADINGLPFTWDETDLSAIAGKASIGGSSGAIVDGKSLRDAFIIYSEQAINALYLSGDEFIWRKVLISSTYGLAAKDSIIEMAGKHYFISQNDICFTDGYTVESILRNTLRNTFNDRTNFQFLSRSYAFHHIVANEFWFCIPSDGAVYANLAYVYNYVDSTWALRNLPIGVPFIGYAIKLSPPVTWATVTGTWATINRKWSMAPYAEEMPLGVINSDSSLVTVDDATVQSFLPILLERTGLNITEDVRSVETLVQMFPIFSGSSSLYIQLGSKDFPGSPIRWQNSEIFDIETRRSLQQNTTGALHCYRIFGVPTNNFTLSGFDLEYTSSGLN